MPKRVNKDNLRKFILSQTNGCFTPDDIAVKCKEDVSAATCYTIIKDMSARGEIILDHKDGRRMYYALSKEGQDKSETASQRNILSIPPEERFSYVSHLADMVIEGVSPSLLLTGMSGIGKTYLIKDRLKAKGYSEGMDYLFIQGHSTPQGLYRCLYEHRDQRIIFDDCDSVFKEMISINILKSALDSYDIRKIDWLSGRLPDDLEPTFEFEGQIIFISNMDEGQIDEAIKSRTMVIDLQMTRKEIVEYMSGIAKVIEPKMSLDHKVEVLSYLDKNRDSFKQFNIRTFIKACRIRSSAHKGVDWKKMLMVLD